MQDNKLPRGQFDIGTFCVDAGNNSIRHHQQIMHVEPRSMHVLWVLAEHAGKTVEREALFEAVWGKQVVVDEALTRTISQLRKAFNDSQAKQLIQTIPKKGYRLASDVRWQQSSDTQDEQAKQYSSTPLVAEAVTVSAEQSSGHSSLHRRGILAAGIMLVLAALISLVLVLMPAQERSETLIDDLQSASVSITPFINQSGNQQHDYLASGIAEEVLNTLARAQGVRVPSRYSAFSHADSEDTLAQIAQRLGVRFMLRGSLEQLDSEGYVIDAELIDTEVNRRIWQRRYSGPQNRFSDAGENITRDILATVQPQPDEIQEALWSPARIDVQAYQHYLKGNYWWMNGSTSEWFYQAENAFLEAIGIDPDFAAAHGSLAYIYARYQFHDIYMDQDDALNKAQYALDRALALNPQQEDALLAKAILATQKQAFDVAKEALDTALSIRSGNAQALYLYGELALAQNQPQKALDYALKAQNADPLSPWVNINLAIVYYYQGKSELALQAIDRALSVDDTYSWGYIWQAKILHSMGRVAEAIIAMQRCLSLDPGSAANNAYLGLLYLELDLQEQANIWFERTALLYGDTVDARFWKSFVRLGYRHQDPQVALNMLNNMQSVRTGTYDLLPLLGQSYLAVARHQQGVADLSSRQPSPLDKHNRVNIDNSRLAIALMGLTGDGSIKKRLSTEIEALERHFGAWTLFSGIQVSRLLNEDEPARALARLQQGYQTGWVENGWLYVNADRGIANAMKTQPGYAQFIRMLEGKKRRQRGLLEALQPIPVPASEK